MISELDELLTYDKVIQELGKFKDDPIMKKHARIGQSFSSTNKVASLEPA